MNLTPACRSDQVDSAPEQLRRRGPQPIGHLRHHRPVGVGEQCRRGRFKQTFDPSVRPVHPAHELNDPLLDAKRPDRERGSRGDFVEHNQPVASQRAVRAEPLARLAGVVLRSEQQAEREVHGCMAAAQIVLHIGVKPLECSIEFGSKRDQQNVALEFVEAENLADHIERRRGAGVLHGAALRDDLVAGAGQRPRDLGTRLTGMELRFGGAFCAGQQPVGLGIGDAPAKPVRRRDTAPMSAQPRDPPLQQQTQPRQLRSHQRTIGLGPGTGMREGGRNFGNSRVHGTAQVGPTYCK